MRSMGRERARGSGHATRLLSAAAGSAGQSGRRGLTGSMRQRPQHAPTPRFLADEMLGKLVRFMRIMGMPAERPSGMGDSEILKLAKAKDLVLLTQDEQLRERARVREIPCMLVPPAPPEKQIAAILARFRLRLPEFPSGTLCPVCGGKLARAKKSEMAGKIPSRVLERRRFFWRCSSCGKLYWSGTHYAKLRKAYWKVKNVLGTD